MNRYLLFAFMMSLMSISVAQVNGDSTIGNSLIEYDFLTHTNNNDTSQYEVFCLCDSGYKESYVTSYDKITFCRKLFYRYPKKNNEKAVVAADFYKVNDTIWNAYYFYPEGYIKEEGQIVILNAQSDTYQIQYVSSYPPYNEYVDSVSVIKTTRYGEWLEFNKNPFSEFNRRRY